MILTETAQFKNLKREKAAVKIAVKKMTRKII
jgi:hypothetical protein